MKKHISNGPNDTKAVGFRLGKLLRSGDVVGLYGELGAGKTTMVKGIASAFGIDEREIVSASFTILTEYDTSPPFTHIDLYRIEKEDELDKLVEAWTINHTAEEVATLLQENGIAAGVVKNARDLLEDPQLNLRRHYVTLNHSEIGPSKYEGPPWLLSKTPAQLRMAAPCLGEHTAYVCTKILGMSDGEFVELLNEGVFT